MAIYSRYGDAVKITSARLVPVWIERRQGEIRWHYKAKKPGKHTDKIEEQPVWHVIATYEKDGDPVVDGKLFPISNLVADHGFKELVEVCEGINPQDAAYLEQWVKADGPELLALFHPIEEKLIA